MAKNYNVGVIAPLQGRPDSVDVSFQGSNIIVQPVQTVYVAQPTRVQPIRSSGFRGKSDNSQFRPQLILGLVVACCCGCVFGIIAVIFAVLAGRRASDGDDLEARQFGRWSFITSVFGIVLGSIVIVAIIVCISVIPRFGLPSQVYTGHVG